MVTGAISTTMVTLSKTLRAWAFRFGTTKVYKHHCQAGIEDESQDDRLKVGFNGGDGAEEVASKDNQRSPGERF